jgi:predicted RNase H-like HicB family nuclease
MQLTIRLLRETDGRWIGDIPGRAGPSGSTPARFPISRRELPGVTVYGSTAEGATLKAKALALRVIAEEIEHGELQPAADTLQFSIPA